MSITKAQYDAFNHKPIRSPARVELPKADTEQYPKRCKRCGQWAPASRGRIEETIGGEQTVRHVKCLQ